MIDNMGQLRNPFVIYGYKGAEYFCDRKKETKTICTALSNERNVVLTSPRRIGKTGLIHHVFEQLKKSEPETKCFYMDINATRNVNQFIQLLAKTVVGQVDTFSQSAFRKILTFFSSYRPTVSFDEFTGIPTFSITISQEQQEESLKHIFDYLKQSGQRIYIAIDEFQQISEYPENSTEALLRSHIQFLPNVYFIFAGSSQHMMSEMFLSAQRPFYQSSQMVNLFPIDVHEYCEFANRWLSKEGIGMEDADFIYLYDMLDGQTWYIQNILNRLYANGDLIDKTTIARTVDDVVNEQEESFITYCKSLTDNQLDLLIAIAKEDGVVSALSQEFLLKYSLPAASSVSLALKALQKKDFVHEFNGRIVVYDRFFGMWLKRG